MAHNKYFKPGTLLRSEVSAFRTVVYSPKSFTMNEINTSISIGDFVVFVKNRQHCEHEGWFYGLHQPTGRILLLQESMFAMVIP